MFRFYNYDIVHVEFGTIVWLCTTSHARVLYIEFYQGIITSRFVCNTFVSFVLNYFTLANIFSAGSRKEAQYYFWLNGSVARKNGKESNDDAAGRSQSQSTYR